MTDAQNLKFSFLVYTSINDEEIQIVIPTIQNIATVKSTKIITKPTVAGNTLAQYSNDNPITVSINILLQTFYDEYTYLNENFKSSDLLTALKEIENNKLTFDLITTDSTLQPYLSNLIIKSKSFTKSTANKNSIICNLECVEIRFAEIGWDVVKKIDVLGTTISEDAAINIRDLIMAKMVTGERVFDTNTILTMFNDTPSELIGKKIHDTMGYLPPHYLQLVSAIDLKSDITQYIINTGFELNAWYTQENSNVLQLGAADFGDITITVHKESTVEYEPFSSVFVKDSLLDLFSREAFTRYSTQGKFPDAYSIFNQYGPFGITESFDKFIDTDTLYSQLSLRIQNDDFFTYDPEYLSTHEIIYLKETSTGSGLVQIMAKDSAKVYSYTVAFGDNDPITISASSFDTNVLTTQTFNCEKNYGGMNPAGPNSYYETHLTHLFIVNISTKLYLFLFSPDAFYEPFLASVQSE